MSEFKLVPPPCEMKRDELLLNLDLVLPSKVEVVNDVVESFRQMLEVVGCGTDLRGSDLALHEALTNAIIHGNRSSCEKAVRVCVALRKDCSLDIQVRDLGPGFDPARLLNPLKAENLLRGSGRGIFFIRQLMDNVQFKFEDGTELSMQRNLRKNRSGSLAPFNLCAVKEAQ